MNLPRGAILCNAPETIDEVFTRPGRHSPNLGKDFFPRLTRILRGKDGKYARGIILEKSKKNRRRIVEIFGECRPCMLRQQFFSLKFSQYLRRICFRMAMCFLFCLKKKAHNQKKLSLLFSALAYFPDAKTTFGMFGMICFGVDSQTHTL
jgi:hypothetical protein